MDDQKPNHTSIDALQAAQEDVTLHELAERLDLSQQAHQEAVAELNEASVALLRAVDALEATSQRMADLLLEVMPPSGRKVFPVLPLICLLSIVAGGLLMIGLLRL